MTHLPEWANKIIPVDMNAAALLLGVSRRFLVDAIKQFPHYERRGSKKVFYPEHIAALRSALSAKAPGAAAGKEFASPLSVGDDAYERAMRLVTEKSSRTNCQRFALVSERMAKSGGES